MNNIKVGYQRLVGKKPPLPVTKKELIPLLECMATKLKDETLAIRNEKDKDRQAQLKRDTLPAIIISAATTSRKASDDDERTGLILIDLDDFGGKANPDVTYEQAVEIVDSMIGEYPFVIGRHTSVRRGLKVACGIEPSVDSHKQSFAALQKLFADHGLTVDKQTSDAKRVNFLCWDADIIETLVVPLKRWMGEFIEPLAEPTPAPTSSPTLTAHTSPSGMSADEEAVICLSHLNPDMDYGDWLATGMACHSHGASMSTWDAWSRGGSKYTEGEPESKWASFEGAGVNFATLVQMSKDANGGVSPLARQRDTVTAADFENLTEEQKAEEDSKFPEPMCGGMMQIDYCHEPEEIIKGVAARGEKMQIAGSSKAGKTWALLHLAGAIQTGSEFMGMECVRGDVLFLNFELSPVRMRQRIDVIPTLRDVTFLNFRGIQCNWAMIKRGLEKLGGNYSTIIFDPIYKMLGDADENSNGDIANLLHHVEQVASERNAMAVYSHHFSKGNKAGVDQIDRQSGAGAWGRDPDALITLTPHEDDGCLVLEHTLRSYAQPLSSVWKFDFPNYVHQPDANPESLKKSRGGSNKKGDWNDALHGVQCHPEGITKADLVKHIIDKTDASDSGARRYIEAAVKKDKIFDNGGLFHSRQQSPQQDAFAEDNYKKAI